MGIFQERISPTAVVGCGNLATVLGWVFWDRWVGQQQAAAAVATASTAQVADKPAPDADGNGISSASSTTSSTGNLGTTSREMNGTTVHGLGLTTSAVSDSNASPKKGVSGLSMDVPINFDPPAVSPMLSDHPTGAARFANYSYCPPYGASASSFSPRNQQRLATAKSASLIYCALLGLSPILKSLTKSTSSDSIWAMSCWLMFINVFFFDYGGAVGAKSVVIPSSLQRYTKLTRICQTPCVLIDECCIDGFDHARLAPLIDDTCLLADPLLDRGLWALSHLPTTPSTKFLAWSRPVDSGFGHRRRRRRGRRHIRWRLACGDGGRGVGLSVDRVRDGWVQLVAHRTAEIQERDTWALGPRSTNSSTTLGLKYIIIIWIPSIEQ